MRTRFRSLASIAPRVAIGDRGRSAKKMKSLSIGPFFAAVSLFHIACTHLPSRIHENKSDSTLSREQALEIAEEYVATHENWGTQAAFGTPRRRSESSTWSVAAWKHPLAPDSHNVIEINSVGEVVSYGSVYPHPGTN
jgi:hypothetical protein